ncbi:uncharacterized protein LOC143291070 isoform X2 [Babylonia areolata]|uniref:uncharacterized protein LOC143291070 isoform X2 n=1 Tax=Babylonia areolata TaxID=304850 RepID=UPI003FD63F52
MNVHIARNPTSMDVLTKILLLAIGIEALLLSAIPQAESLASRQLLATNSQASVNQTFVASPGSFNTRAPRTTKSSTTFAPKTTTTQRPKTTTQRPTTTTQRPKTTTQRPKTTTQRPTTATQRPTTQRPTAATQRPVSRLQLQLRCANAGRCLFDLQPPLTSFRSSLVLLGQKPDWCNETEAVTKRCCTVLKRDINSLNLTVPSSNVQRIKDFLTKKNCPRLYCTTERCTHVECNLTSCDDPATPTLPSSSPSSPLTSDVTGPQTGKNGDSTSNPGEKTARTTTIIIVVVSCVVAFLAGIGGAFLITCLRKRWGTRKGSDSGDPDSRNTAGRELNALPVTTGLSECWSCIITGAGAVRSVFWWCLDPPCLCSIASTPSHVCAADTACSPWHGHTMSMHFPAKSAPPRTAPRTSAPWNWNTRTDLPWNRTDIPGNRTDFSGNRTNFPRNGPHFPLNRTDFSGNRADFSGNRTDFPRNRTKFPRNGTHFPLNRTDFSGNRTDFSGSRTNFPGNKTDFSGNRTDFPGNQADSFPGTGTDFPWNRTGKQDRFSQNRTDFPWNWNTRTDFRNVPHQSRGRRHGKHFHPYPSTDPAFCGSPSWTRQPERTCYTYQTTEDYSKYWTQADQVSFFLEKQKEEQEENAWGTTEEKAMSNTDCIEVYWTSEEREKDSWTSAKERPRAEHTEQYWTTA